MSAIRILIGCYTDDIDSAGIKIVEFDQLTSGFALIGEIKTPNASHFHIERNHLFVVNENGADSDTISSYDISDLYDIRFLDKTLSRGASPCYISCNHDLKHVFVANYYGGNVVAVPLNEKREFDGLTQNIIPVDEKGLRSHTHAAVLSPNEQFLLVANLGLDTISVYPYNSRNNPPLEEANVFIFQFESGTGPRHLTFSKDGEYVYAIGELSAVVHVFRWNAGVLERIQTIAIMPDSYVASSSAAEIQFTPTGDFLYVSNRGDANQLVIFSVDKQSGRLTFFSRHDSLGKGPRNFTIDPASNIVFVTNQYTDDVTAFLINEAGPEKGQLNFLNKFLIKAPVFVKVLG